MDPRCPTASERQLELQLASFVHLTLHLPVVTPVAISVYAVLVGLHRIVPVGEEREVDREFARGPVGHGADVPLPAPSACDHDVVSDSSVKNFGFVPLTRDRLQE